MMKTGEIRVLIVKADDTERQHLADSVSRLTGILVSRAYPDLLTAIHNGFASAEVDVLLVDSDSSDAEDIRSWGIVRAALPRAHIAALTAGEDPRVLDFLLAIGAKALWLPWEIEPRLGRALNRASKGQFDIHPELLHRLKTAWMWGPGDGLLRVGDLEIDTRRQQVCRSGQVIPLSHLEFDLLVYLALNAGRPVGFVELMEVVWGLSDADGATRDQLWGCVKRLRAKLSSSSQSTRYIRTLRGVGYIFDFQSANGAAP